MTLVSARVEDREPGGEDADACYEATNKLLKEFPDLKGIAAFGSQGPIGAGRALRDLGREDVHVVGAAIPSQVGQLLKDGYVKAAYLWDPRDAGYAMIAVAHRILGGGEIETGTRFPSLGEATVNKGRKEHRLRSDPRDHRRKRRRPRVLRNDLESRSASWSRLLRGRRITTSVFRGDLAVRGRQGSGAQSDS